MAIEPPDLARARLTLRKVVRDHLFDPNVSCVDVGLPAEPGDGDPWELRIRVHVHRKLGGLALEQAVTAGRTRLLPDEVDGIPVDVLEGTYRPHLFGLRSPIRQPVLGQSGRMDPMRGGASISDEHHAVAGTLGGKVIDEETGAEMILSNWHVLVGDWSTRPGQRIYQPGRLDGGAAADTVALLTRDGMSVGLDGAVATLTGSRPLVNDQRGLGQVTGIEHAVLGMDVAKSGRTSGVTYGRVTGVEGTARIRYGYLDRIIRKVATIDQVGAGEVSRPGDSGALWLRRETNTAVALHFAGSDTPERALGMDIQTVLTALRVRLDTRASARQRFDRGVTDEGLGRRVLRPADALS